MRFVWASRVACSLRRSKVRFAKLCFERDLGAFAILEAGFEFTFAQGEHVRADFEICFRIGGTACIAAELLLSTPAAFVKGLHPEGLGDVRDGFGEAVEGGGARVSRDAKRFHQASSIGLMVLGEPRPIFSRILSIVGRSPARNSASAASSTSRGLMPRAGEYRRGSVVDSDMYEIIQHTITT